MPCQPRCELDPDSPCRPWRCTPDTGCTRLATLDPVSPAVATLLYHLLRWTRCAPHRHRLALHLLNHPPTAPLRLGGHGRDLAHLADALGWTPRQTWRIVASLRADPICRVLLPVSPPAQRIPRRPANRTEGKENL